MRKSKNYREKIHRLFVLVLLSICAYAVNGQVLSEIPKDVSDGTQWFELGEKQLAKGNFEDAIYSFTRCLVIEKSNTRCLIKRGVSYSKANKFIEAIEDLDRAIEIDPKSAEAYLERGKLEIGDEGEIKYFTKAIELKPDYADAYYQRGLTYFLIDKEKSLADNTKVIELDPSNFESYITRGNIFRLRGDNARAIADYSKAVEINPDDRTFYIRGQTYLEMGFFNKAVEDLTRSAELRPDYYWTYINRAKAYRGLRKIYLARADEKRAAEICKPGS
ncbi:MAG: tetratricopeptide repeat protein [Pyrinomonadaceae bacterium]|nr:tetratricopeptide repeat protein [Pyrinomonadaceae bacterium]